MRNQTGETKPPAPCNSFQVKAGWLIDGLGNMARRQVLVSVSDGLITGISPLASGCEPADAIDFSHATVLPLLMDAHVHLALSGTLDERERKEQLTFDHRQVATVVNRHLQVHWRHGVSMVRDAGDRRGSVWFNLRGRSAAPQVPVAAALTRWAWHAAGRYGAMIGQAPAPGLTLAEAVTPWLADIDHVKVIQSGLNSLDRFGRQGPPQFSQADLSGLVTGAHRRGLKIMAHANGEDAVRTVLNAACDSLEHGYFMGSDNLRRLTDHRVVWIPTLAPMAALAGSVQLTKAQKETAQRTLDHQMKQIQEALHYGAIIGLGTDAGSLGVDHGLAAHRELGLLMDAGLSLEKAVGCASANISKLLGQDRSGALITGHFADFLVIPGSPDRLRRGLSRIMATCRRGIWFPAPHAP